MAQGDDDLSRIDLTHAGREHLGQALFGHVVVISMKGMIDTEASRTLVQLLKGAVGDQVCVPAPATTKDRPVDEQRQSYFSVRTLVGAIPSSKRLRSASSTISGGPHR